MPGGFGELRSVDRVGRGNLASSNAVAFVLISDPVASGRVVSTCSERETLPPRLIGDSHPGAGVSLCEGP